MQEARPLLVLVGAFGIPLAAYAEGPPVRAAVAVHSSWTAEGETVKPVHIEKGCEIFAHLALDAGGDDREVVDEFAAQQHRAPRQIEVSPLTEEECAALVYALRDDHHSAALFGSLVYYALYKLGLHIVRIAYRAEVGDIILSAEALRVRHGSVLEPFGDGSSVREEQRLRFNLLRSGGNHHGQSENCQKKSFHWTGNWYYF